MENRAHMEPLEERKKRFQEGSPTDIIETLLNSLDSYFNNEIRLTIKNGHYQTSLLFLGIHAVALTISEAMFDKTGPDGYKLFLEKFIDGDRPDTKLSDIAELIHNWRNILAHQWLGVGGYTIGYDYTMTLGWERRNEVTFINPRIYCDHYLNAFSTTGRIWVYVDLLDEATLLKVKQRLLTKFLSR